MIEFVDKTESSNGTRIDRTHMMAIQGFVTNTIIFLSDGSIVETNAEGHTKTTRFNSNGSIEETFVGNKTITKITEFENGNIKETII